MPSSANAFEALIHARFSVQQAVPWWTMLQPKIRMDQIADRFHAAARCTSIYFMLEYRCARAHHQEFEEMLKSPHPYTPGCLFILGPERRSISLNHHSVPAALIAPAANKSKGNCTTTTGGTELNGAEPDSDPQPR